MLGGGPTFKPAEGTVVLDEDLRPLPAGSDRIGKIARTGHIPLAYYKDPVKSAQVFFTAPDGQRYSMPGDFASTVPSRPLRLMKSRSLVPVMINVSPCITAGSTFNPWPANANFRNELVCTASR